ncbi:hypothetical protein SPI_05281 [Niveomyces insectorum RCEF 264]|uniref:N-acetylglucosamine-induced protein 1 n=1 Tax=Niveomyces insectorum RCEF 264 TaxID=1081102 RepID=A0A167U595_9HYPO|nr:hypothetical protein SPI_05281 [Niveomyces insectorum RCEF 264]
MGSPSTADHTAASAAAAAAADTIAADDRTNNNAVSDDTVAATLLPYWQVNVPPAERTVECPAFLCNLSAKDRGILATPQAQAEVASWAAVRALVAANRLDAFQRTPCDLRRYLAYAWQLRQRYGSAEQFVLKERLQWSTDETPWAPSDEPPFSHPSDVRILCNDWPYAIDPRIVHLVVWTKFPLAEDPATGDLTPTARAAIDAFVTATFGSLPREQYVWFKNWRALKSMRQVEHFHVLVYDPPAGFVARITDGDVPLSQREAAG